MDRGRSNATRLGEQTDYFVVVSVIVDPSEPCWIDRARIRERNHRDEPCDQNQCDDHQEWLPTSGVSGSSHYAPLPLFMDGRPLRSWDQRGRNFRRSDELCQASLTHHLVFMTNRSAALLRVGKSFLMTRGIHLLWPADCCHHNRNVVVAALAAKAAASDAVTITSIRRPTRSAARSASRSVLPSARRHSNTRFWPST